MKTRCVLFAMAIAACIGRAQTYPVAGLLLDSNTRTPLKRFHVTLAPAAARTQEVGMVTGDDGRFSFTVPQGVYSLYAENSVSRQAYGSKAPLSGFASQVVAGPDHDTSHLEFLWLARGAIYGKVTDSDGEPVLNARVQLFRSTVTGGRRRSVQITLASTDETGAYRLPFIPGGSYYMVVTGEPWRASATIGTVSAADQPTTPSNYAPAYFPNTSDPHSAGLLNLRAGEEFRADFTIVRTRGASIVLTWDGDLKQIGVANLYTLGPGGIEISVRSNPNVQNRQTWTAVPPGRYILRAEKGALDGLGAQGARQSARKIIDVGGADVTVDLALLPPPKVSGKVTYKSAKPRSTLLVRLVNEESGTPYTRTVDPDGAFNLPALPPGKYRASLSGTEPFVISQMTVEGAPIANQEIEIADGAQVKVNIVASDDAAELKGFVMRGETAVDQVLAVLAPREGSARPVCLLRLPDRFRRQLRFPQCPRGRLRALRGRQCRS